MLEVNKNRAKTRKFEIYDNTFVNVIRKPSFSTGV